MSQVNAIPLTQRHVIVVDDEQPVRNVVRRALERAGYQTTTCSGGAEVLRLLDEIKVDVIISDINMPDMDGLQMMTLLKDKNLQTQVIFATGAPSVETAAQAVECGAFRYLSKPIEPEQLCSIVEEAILAQSQLSYQRALAEAEQQDVRTREALSKSFGDALGQIYMAYQPILKSKSREIIACEALVRSSHSEISHPGLLFGAAEQLGTLQDLGRAIRNIAPAPAVNRDDILLFVNLHTSDLNDESLYESDSPLSLIANQVVLEITERASLESIQSVTEKVDRLRQLGFQLAVDDLGAGYSGLNALALLEPEYVKLDMSLVRDIHESKTKRTLVRAVTNLSHDLKAKVVAEGVETAQELEVLEDFGCDLLQGFFLGRPVREFPKRVELEATP